MYNLLKLSNTLSKKSPTSEPSQREFLEKVNDGYIITSREQMYSFSYAFHKVTIYGGIYLRSQRLAHSDILSLFQSTTR